MNAHYDEARRLLDASADLNRGLTDRQILAIRAQAEATLAVVYELQQPRPAAPTTGPSHTGAAPFTSGALVTVNNPRSEWYGMTGTITHTGHGITTVRFPGNNTQPIANQHLTKAEQP